MLNIVLKMSTGTSPRKNKLFPLFYIFAVHKRIVICFTGIVNITNQNINFTLSYY